MIEEIRELFQTLIAPQFEGIKGDIRALDAKIASLDSKFDAKIEGVEAKNEAKVEALEAKIEGVEAKIEAVEAKAGAIDTKMGSFRRELLAEIRRVEEVLSADFVRLEEKVDLRLANVDTRLIAMNEKIDLYRQLR